MPQDIQTIDPETGEVMTVTEQPVALAVQLAQAELNQAVTTAKAFPRNLRQVQQNIMALATLDEETAAESVYALPRSGKPIKGASIRFAEIVASQYGNCHTGSRIVAVDRFEKVVVAEGVFLDLETGMKRTAQIRRKISDKYGRIYNDDMITVTGNAAASIAMREAILKGIPKALWRRAYEHCEKVIAGDVQTLTVRRERAITSFAVWGIKPEQIFASLEVEGVDGIGLDELATLFAMHKAIKSGDQKVEDYFPAVSDPAKATEAAKGTAAKLNDIAKEGEAAKEGAPANEQGSPTAGEKPKKAAKPKEEQKASQQPAPQDGEAKAGEPEQGKPADGEQAAESGETTGAPSFSDEDIEGAFQKGADAKRKGMGRKTLPGEWRAEGFEPLADAWVRGWTETEAT